MTTQQEVDTTFQRTDNVPISETGQLRINTGTPVSTSVALDRQQNTTDPLAPIVMPGQVVRYTVTF